MSEAPQQKEYKAIDIYNGLNRHFKRAVVAEMKRQEKRGEQPHLAKAMHKLGIIRTYRD